MAHKERKYHSLKDLFYPEYDDKSMEPSRLRDITDNFSKKLEIGTGGFGVVYKGELLDGCVAVKKFHSVMDDEAFMGEVECLRKIEHRNIVRYIGYCIGAYKIIATLGKKNIFAESPYQLICFEYLQNGSLDGYLNAQPCRLAWHLCYKIIQGICLGLHHLHEHKIIHRDIKPENILLDDDMAPKIADFGLSRFLEDGKSRILTSKAGTLAYMAPECTSDGVFTFKSDIYSLGVIIRQIVMGRNIMASKEETLYEWSRRLNLDRSQSHTLLDQVEACINMSISCTDGNITAESRPDTQDILRRLGITETRSWSAISGISTSSVPPSSACKELKVEAEPSTKASVMWPGNTSSENLQGRTNATSKILPSRSLKIANNRPRFWRWHPLRDSSFGECVELLSVYFLAVAGDVPSRELFAGVIYEVYLVYKLSNITSGLRGSIQTSSLRLHGEQIVSTKKVCLQPKAHEMVDDVTYPVERGDGWLELRLAKFVNDDKMLMEEGVIVDLREEEDTIKKSGLIVAGMELRSN